MQIEHFILARDSSIDQNKNSLSVFDIIEDIQIQINQPGAVIPLNVQAIAVFKRESEKGEVSTRVDFRVFSPLGKEIASQILPFHMKTEHRRYRMRVNFPIMISQSGEYRFLISLDGSASVRKEIFLNIQVDLVEQAPTYQA